MIEQAGPQRNILVVDDDSLVRQTIQLLLAGDGCVVHEADSASAALALFGPGKFDLIFTDYYMPVMKGDALAAEIKKQSPDQPVVMITAFPEKLQTSECALGGSDTLICKPFDLEDLRAAVDLFAPG